jgi:hypothetical protein
MYDLQGSRHGWPEILWGDKRVTSKFQIQNRQIKLYYLLNIYNMKTLFFLTICAVLNHLMVSCSSPESDLKEAQRLNTIESYRSFMAKYELNTQIREKAIDELSDQQIIAMFAIEEVNDELRKKAFAKLTDQGSLANVILKSKDSELVDSAWVRLNDQGILMSLADSVTAAVVRLRAIYKINNDDFLLKRSRVDISDAIRVAAVEQMKSDTILTDVAINSYYYELRCLAKSKVTDRSLIEKINASESAVQKNLENIQIETNQETLSEIALKSNCDIICMAAASRLKDEKALTNVVINSTDRNVAKVAFTELNDKDGLEKVVQSASDNAIKIAASVKLHQKSLGDFFSEATSRGKTSKEMGDVLAAVSLLPSQQNISDLVTGACLTLIRRGDESRIPELVELLNAYGDVSLTEDYLNCGQPDLYTAGKTWADNHGYYIKSGYGSNRARWGSGN